MFGIIFALIITLLVLAAVSYMAWQFYKAVQKLSEENETLKNDHARAAQAAIEYCTLAEDFRSELRTKSFQMIDMEAALNVALQESIDANGQIKIKGTTREFVDMVPILKAKKEPELLIVGTMSNIPPVVKAEQIWIENLETGEKSDISTHVDLPAFDDGEKFDEDFWKRLNPPYPVTDTMTIEVGGESLKALSQKIPGIEEMPEWEKELRKNPENYTELPRPEKREVDQKEATRILDGIFGPVKKSED